jgi:hypothetical protein
MVSPSQNKTSFTGKERLNAALAHQEPDRVPTGEMGIDYPIIEKILGHETFYRAQGKERQAIWAGKRDLVVKSQKEDLVALVRRLEWDLVPVWITYSSQFDYTPPRFLTEDHLKWEDYNGNIWQVSSDLGDALCTGTNNISREKLEQMNQSPPAVDPSQLELIEYVVQQLGQTHFIVGRGWHAPSTSTDGSFPLGGEGLSLPVDQFLMLIYDDPELVHAILSAYTKRAIEYGQIMIKAGVDAILINADYGINTGPWLSPKMFKQFVLPYLRQEVEAFHAMGASVIKHTDGNTLPLLDMIVETGIDGLHGIQPSIGMNLTLLKSRYGDKIVLFGAEEAETLINGTPQDAIDEVERCIRAAASGGGYVLTTSNSVQAGSQVENYLAMLNHARLIGTYPILQ